MKFVRPGPCTRNRHIACQLASLLLIVLANGCQVARFQSPEPGLETADVDDVDIVGQPLARQQLLHFETLPGDPTPRMDLALELSNTPLAPNDRSDRIVGPRRQSSLWNGIRSDYANFYHRRNLPLALTALGVGAWMANTDVDQSILDHIQQEITFGQSDEYYEFIGENKFFGEGYYLVPVYAGSALLGNQMIPDTRFGATLGEWGERSFRSVLVGFPPLVVAQHVLGASRPNETHEGSEWQFLQDNNGVSGHSFMGAIPFLTAANMTRNRFARAFLIGASTVPALSRITENGHFPSQALLGWTLAVISTQSVERSIHPSDLRIQPLLFPEGFGLGLSWSR